MKLTRDIQSLGSFERDTAKLVRQLKKTREPVVLTVNGKAELVVQDAESYQKTTGGPRDFHPCYENIACFFLSNKQAKKMGLRWWRDVVILS